MRSAHASLVAASLLLFGGSAEAHITLTSPPPRFEAISNSNPNQKVGPCGDGTPSGAITDWVVGEQVTIGWTETIDHSGHFRIALDPTGTDNFNNPDPPNNTAVVGNVLTFVPDDKVGGAFTADIIVPNYDCDPCTLQVIQYMAGAAQPFYYWCADVRITGGGSSSATTTTTTSTGSGAGGSGTGGSDVGGSDDPTSGTGPSSTQYPNYASDEGGCSLASAPAGSRDGFGALLALGLLLYRRRN